MGQSSIQARVLLVRLVSMAGARQMEMLDFSYNSYSGRHGLNVLDASWNVIVSD